MFAVMLNAFNWWINLATKYMNVVIIVMALQMSQNVCLAFMKIVLLKTQNLLSVKTLILIVLFAIHKLFKICLVLS